MSLGTDRVPQSFREAVRLAPLALLLACGGIPGFDSACLPLAGPGALEGPLDESSGIAISRVHPDVFWTHNDSGSPPVVFAVDRDGAVLGRVRVTGARNQDWEDIAAGPCPEGSCLYIADTGDNAARRGRVVVYRIPEPHPVDSASAPAVRMDFRYPEGPRDVESIFVLPDTSISLVTKGRRVPIEVFRHAAPFPAGEPGMLERVQVLTESAPSFAGRVTGGGASPDGRLVALRTQELLVFYDVEDGVLVPRPDPVSLRTLREAQGEAVDLDGDGLVVLTSEAGPLGRRGSITLLECETG